MSNPFAVTNPYMLSMQGYMPSLMSSPMTMMSGTPTTQSPSTGLQCVPGDIRPECVPADLTGLPQTQQLGMAHAQAPGLPNPQGQLSSLMGMAGAPGQRAYQEGNVVAPMPMPTALQELIARGLMG